MSVIFNFQAMGQTDVISAFKQIGKVSDDSTKQIIQGADRQLASMKKLKDQIIKIRKEQYGEDEKAAKKNTDVIVREYDRQVKAAETAANQKIKAAEKAAAAELKAAEKAARAAERAAEKTKKDSTFSKIKNGFGVGAGFSITSSAIGLGMGVAGVGLDYIGGSARKGAELRSGIRNLYKAQGSGQGKSLAQIDKEIESQAVNLERNAAEYGADPRQLLAAQTSLQAKAGGDTNANKLIKNLAPNIAKYMTTTGASGEDIAGVLAPLIKSGVIKSTDDADKYIARIYSQGKSGQVEFKDAAGTATELAAITGSNTMGESLRDMGMLQLATGGTGDPKKALTSINALYTAFKSKSTDLQAMGVNVWTDKSKTKLRSVEDLIPEVLQKSGGDLSKLNKIFGTDAIKSFTLQQQEFNRAREAAIKEGKTKEEANKSGADAAKKLQDEAINAKSADEDFALDTQISMNDPMLKLETVFDKLSNAISDTLIPILTAMAEKLGIIKSADELKNEAIQNKYKNKREQLDEEFKDKQYISMGQGVYGENPEYQKKLRELRDQQNEELGVSGEELTRRNFVGMYMAEHRQEFMAKLNEIPQEQKNKFTANYMESVDRLFEQVKNEPIQAKSSNENDPVVQKFAELSETTHGFKDGVKEMTNSLEDLTKELRIANEKNKGQPLSSAGVLGI